MNTYKRMCFKKARYVHNTLSNTTMPSPDPVCGRLTLSFLLFFFFFFFLEGGFDHHFLSAHEVKFYYHYFF